MDKMRWERSRLRGLLIWPGFAPSASCPAFFSSSLYFRETAFPLHIKRPRSPGDPGAGRGRLLPAPPPLHPAPSPQTFQGPLFRRTFFLPACSLLRQVWSSLDLAGRRLRRRRCCKRPRGELAQACPLAPGRGWLAVGSLVGGVCVPGRGAPFLASAYPENRYLDWGGPRARSVVGAVRGTCCRGAERPVAGRLRCGFLLLPALETPRRAVAVVLPLWPEAGGSVADAVGNGWFFVCLF